MAQEQSTGHSKRRRVILDFSNLEGLPVEDDETAAFWAEMDRREKTRQTTA
ncbi:hypothetical protein [Streptomyces ipomoeae]|uniref:hypothetical protein n=1 Tax=Streptomyces ipomoeae TaxID=103232 RepID=UPI0015F0861D|nr:hypothetical protein [Streptomyces ipomoeae]